MNALKRFIRLLNPGVLQRAVMYKIFHARIVKKPLSVFRIGSANDKLYPELTYQAANRFPFQLHELLARLETCSPVEIVEAESIATDADISTSARQLGELFDSNGSDKARHGYHPIYASIFHNLGRDRPLTVLEIGLGTNDPLAPSTMGATGIPGASLRAFRDFLPASTICGADIERAILFREDRIKTAFLDQTDIRTFDEMANSLNMAAFDLIVDDGLHSVEANMNTVLYAIRALKMGGWLVIEDIPERTVIVWKSIVQLLNQSHFNARLAKANFAYLVVAERLAPDRSSMSESMKV